MKGHLKQFLGYFEEELFNVVTRLGRRLEEVAHAMALCKFFSDFSGDFAIISVDFIA